MNVHERTVPTSEQTDGAASPLSRRRFLQMCAGGVAAWSVLGGQAGAAYASAGMRGPAARTIPFNAHWLFGGPAVVGCTRPKFDDSAFEEVTLPHTVTDLSWREWDPATWQKVWIYRRHFEVPPLLRDHRLFLDFGAAMTATELTLNGRRLGEHVGGYLPFSFEVTDALIPGENVLAVLLDARFNINVPPNRPIPYGPRSVDFWQPGSIYRPASLRAVPQVFLADVFAKPVHALGPGRRLEVECTVDVGVVPEGPVTIEVELRKGDQKVAAASSAPVTLEKPGQTPVRLTLNGLDDIELWDIKSPRLYNVVATLLVDGEPVHDYATRTGFREARFTEQGFFLNGRHLKIFGLNRHQVYPFAGHAMPDRVQRKDAELLKHELNCNMVRCSHYPQSEAFFEACDELGLMAWEEAPGWGLYMGNEQWQARAVRIVGDMVRRGRNHPSIIIWGARINETPDNVELWSKTRDLAHRLDDSRPTTGAMIGGLYDSKKYVQDVFSLNDYWREDGHAALRPPRTDFPYLASEAVGTLTGPSKYYRRDDPIEVQQGEAIAHAWVHDQAFADDRYCGLLAWCGFDYPSGSGNQWRGVKYNGVVDLFRELKPGAAIYQAQVNPQDRPVIMPAFYWDFSGPQALPLDEEGPTGGKAMICSNCERLELFVGDEHYATVHPDTERFGHLPYPPSFADFGDVDGATQPELRIDGYVGGEQVHSRRFSSDPSGDVLAVTTDDTELIADGSDATRVAFRVLDKYGAPRYYVGDVAKQVSVTVDGPGRLVGDSPFAFAEAGGVGAVWIRTRYGNAGEITVTVSHPRLGSRTATIQANKLRAGGLDLSSSSG